MSFSSQNTLKEIRNQRKALKLQSKDQVVINLESFLKDVQIDEEIDEDFRKFTTEAIANAIVSVDMINSASELELNTVNWIQLVSAQNNPEKRQVLLMIGSIVLAMDV